MAVRASGLLTGDGGVGGWGGGVGAGETMRCACKFCICT